MKTNLKISNFEEIDKMIENTKKLYQLQSSTEFIEFVKDKTKNLLEQIMAQKFNGSSTSNNLEIEDYKKNNHFENIKNGFILRNNTTIPADKYNTLPFDMSGYADGEFSIALAFEYGTGIYGQANLRVTNRSKNSKGNSWYLPKNVYGKSGILTEGYPAFGIYTELAKQINLNIDKWFKEFLEKRGVSYE